MVRAIFRTVPSPAARFFCAARGAQNISCSRVLVTLDVDHEIVELRSAIEQNLMGDSWRDANDVPG